MRQAIATRGGDAAVTTGGQGRAASKWQHRGKGGAQLPQMPHQHVILKALRDCTHHNYAGSTRPPPP